MPMSRKFKIENANLFKRITQWGPIYYVSYNGKDYNLQSKSWEEARKEAEEMMYRINPNIVVN